ncbi:polysaccharide deacetylase [Leptospira perolatii]|uniref:Polysaccharide deacetylase n=2 Tax=Leptospira perolatii TaxID=2023191 RepID=A0A2M9ZPW7_9LEPT|nr:polysaccharide deacetylase [Leptospira perolatii]PJZ74029.1 polysaccharide deacetylase [Leptospira perolatii]
MKKLVTFLWICILQVLIVQSIYSGPINDFLSPEKSARKNKSQETAESPPKSFQTFEKNDQITLEVKNKIAGEKEQHLEPEENEPPRIEPSNSTQQKEEPKTTDPVLKTKKKVKKSNREADIKEPKGTQDVNTEKKKKYDHEVKGVSNLPASVAYNASKEKGGGHGKGIPVLCYHHLFGNGNPMGGYNLDPGLLEEQFKFLKALGYQTVSLDQFYDYIQGNAPKGFPEKPILLTFDDGSLSHNTVLVPLLKKYGFRASIFIYPTVISNPKFKYYLSWTALKEALNSGVLDLGSHTIYHPKLPTMHRSEIRNQLRNSKAILEAKTGWKVKDLAYPFGLYDTRVIEEAKSAGYRMAFTVNPGKNIPGSPAYTLHRSLVSWGQSQSKYSSILSASYPGKIILGIENGSWVRPGDTFKVTVEGLQANSVKMLIRNKNAILSRTSENEYTIQIPTFKSRASYLPFSVQGKTKDGIKTETQFLFINRSAFKKDPD